MTMYGRTKQSCRQLDLIQTLNGFSLVGLGSGNEDETNSRNAIDNS